MFRIDRSDRGVRRGFGVAGLVLVACGALAFAADQPYKCTKDLQLCLNEMASSLRQRGWVGIELDESSSGKPPRVVRVVAGGPAEAAGMRAGDLLLAVDGVRYDTAADRERMGERRKRMRPGMNEQYTIQRGGKERVITVTLGSLPSDVMAQWIGMHMLEHAQLDASAE